MHALLVDFGNVVGFFDHRRACRQLAALSRRGLDADAIYRIVFESPLEPEVDRGRVPRHEFLDRLRVELGLEASDEAIARAWADIFEPNEHLIAQLPAARALAGRLVLASNTNDIHFEWIRRQFADALSTFDAFVVSYEAGTRKPEAEFFVRCAGVAGVPASACVFVDDKAEFVAAATALGMSGIVYTPGLDLVGAVRRAVS